MRHAYIDEHSGIDSPIHGLDPRIKIISFVGFILFVVFTKPLSFTAFLMYAFLMGILLKLSMLPFKFILKRSLVIIPFVLMISIFIPFLEDDGLLIFWNVLIKAYLSILAMILLISTTRVRDILLALQKMRSPLLFIMIFSFMYRYIFVIQDELMKMYQAKESRTLRRSKWIDIKALSNMIGVLFIRAFERGENVYLAMCSRGFSGEIKTINNLQLRRRDLYFLFIMIGALVSIRSFGV